MISELIPKNNELNKITYPCLMQGMVWGGVVILMSGEGEGTVVGTLNNNSHLLGYHSISWNMTDFQLFNGRIELQN